MLLFEPIPGSPAPVAGETHAEQTQSFQVRKTLIMEVQPSLNRLAGRPGMVCQQHRVFECAADALTNVRPSAGKWAKMEMIL